MQPTTLKDGFGIAVSFGLGESGTNHAGTGLLIDPTSITPPGTDAGDAIDTTTHSNTAYRTKWPRQLEDFTDGACTCVYNPDDWAAILAMVNDNQPITFTFPDNSSIMFYGFIRSFTPNAFVEGEQATAEVVFVVSNISSVDGAETAPIYTEGS